MRQVKIVATDELMPHQIEETLNEIFTDIHEENGLVEKTEYCIDRRTGTLTMVVIEYDK